MSQPDTTLNDPIQSAYEQGRRMGLATAAFALSVIAFLNLLGIEKSLLALVLGFVAIKGTAVTAAIRTRGRNALVIASIHAITVIVALFLLRDKLGQLIELLHSLS
jgi:hypothetical protein